MTGNPAPAEPSPVQLRIATANRARMEKLRRSRNQTRIAGLIKDGPLAAEDLGPLGDALGEEQARELLAAMASVREAYLADLRAVLGAGAVPDDITSVDLDRLEAALDLDQLAQLRRLYLDRLRAGADPMTEDALALARRLLPAAP